MLQESFTPQESGSDFASVVYTNQDPTTWQKLRDTDPFTLFHAKFWGKSMAVEEQEWRSVQSGDPARAREDQDGDDPMGDDVDEDDDIIPGCYLLDLGIDGTKIWIRADYIRIYNFLEAHYEKSPAPSFRAPAAVITGQPGIGQFQGVFVCATTDMTPFQKERVSGSTTPCVDASLNGSQSSCTTNRIASSS